MFVSFFSTKCKYYKQTPYSKKLNDRLVDYAKQAKKSGISECKNEDEIKEKIAERKLFKIKNGRKYVIDKMSYSYPCLTREGKILLDEIENRFSEKIEKVGLKGTKFILTSMTRTTDKKKLLKKTNGNFSDNSPHLNGNAFDISYVRFSYRKLHVTECDKYYLKEALAEVIWQLRKEKKCWATFERVQGCYHIVSR